MNNDLTVSEVAKKLKVSSRTIQREIKRGKLTAHKVGRKFLVSDASLQRYLERDSQQLEAQIQKFLQSKKYEMVDLLQRMVAMQSNADKGKDQEELAKFIKHTLESMGIRCVLYGEGEEVSVHGTFGYAKKAILLNCPIDTADVGDLDRWSYPPFDGVVKNGKMYGRGTADCKAGIVAMIYSVAALKQVVDEHKVRIELVFDGGEQNGRYRGMMETLQRGIDVDAGIIGYAGDQKELAIGARGYHRYTFSVKGKAAHTGARHNMGINAISKMAKFILELEKVDIGKSKHELFWFGSRLTPSIISGGRAINVVPDECILQVDTRIPPDFSKKQIDLKISEIVRKIKKTDPDFFLTFTYDVGNEGYMVKKGEKIITNVLKAIQTTINEKPELIANGQAHVGNLLHKYNIPVIVKGPVGGNVHSYDEYVTIDSIPQTSEIYAKTVLNYFDISE